MAYYDNLASAIYNNVFLALRGINSNPIVPLRLIADECILARLSIIKEYTMKGLVPRHDLILSITCIPIDCLSLDGCAECGKSTELETIAPHFELPLIIAEFDDTFIDYIGSTDLMYPFIVYTTPTALRYNKYRAFGKSKPYVYVNLSPNPRGKLDCYLFNAPLTKLITVSAIFKDPRELEDYGCCAVEDTENLSFIDTEVEKRVTEQMLRYYRQLITPVQPNNLQPR